MLTTQRQIISRFKAENPDLNFKPQRNGDYPTDTRCAFVDYIDYLQRNGEISEKLAQKAHLTPPRRNPPQPRPVHIEGRRWFDKSAGNTYNSVVIYLSDQSTVYLSRHYGYGDYYLQRAEAWIKKHRRYPNPDNLSGTRYLREVVKVSYSVSDVSRKKDL